MFNSFLAIDIVGGGVTPPPGLVKDDSFQWKYTIAIILVILLAIFIAYMIWGLIKSLIVTKKYSEEDDDDFSNKSDE